MNAAKLYDENGTHVLTIFKFTNGRGDESFELVRPEKVTVTRTPATILKYCDDDESLKEIFYSMPKTKDIPVRIGFGDKVVEECTNGIEKL